MKAVILAAGKGERLKGVIDSIPKPMVQINGKPILEHNIKWLRNYGITDIYINLHHLPDMIRSYFSEGSRWGVSIVYSYESELLGTAGAVRKIAGECRGYEKEPFLVVYGDNLLSDFNLNQIINFHKTKMGIGTIVLYRKKEVNQSGIAIIDNENKIIKFIEKPKPNEAMSNLVNTGIYVLEPRILEYIPKNGFSDFGKDIFPEIIRSGKSLFGIVLEKRLIAVDTPELLEKAIGRRKDK